MKHLMDEDDLRLIPHVLPDNTGDKVLNIPDGFFGLFNSTRQKLIYQWEITEDIQDHSPYLEFGWYGFIPLVIFRS